MYKVHFFCSTFKWLIFLKSHIWIAIHEMRRMEVALPYWFSKTTIHCLEICIMQIACKNIKEYVRLVLFKCTFITGRGIFEQYYCKCFVFHLHIMALFIFQNTLCIHCAVSFFSIQKLLCVCYCIRN